MKKVILSAIIFYFFAYQATAQIDNGNLKKNKDLEFSVGPTATRIKNKSIKDDEFKTVDIQSGLNFDISFNKYKNNRVGIGIGLGCSSYNQIIYQKGLFVSFSQIDRDGNTYDKWINSDITYTNKIVYLDVPVTLHLLLGRSNKFYGYIDVGVINQFLLNAKSTEVGKVENMGKYPTSNPYFSLISQNNSYYNYAVKYYDLNHDDFYKLYNISGHFAFGIVAIMTERVSLKVQPYINVGFSDITAKEFKGQDYQNVFGRKSDYQATKLFSAGLNVGFTFNIGS
jgi:hypothetical protein